MTAHWCSPNPVLKHLPAARDAVNEIWRGVYKIVLDSWHGAEIYIGDEILIGEGMVEDEIYRN